jgi:hypothetical protein
MSWEQKLTTVSMIAGVDLSTKQYRFVDLASDGQIDPVASANGRAVGVLQNKPAAAGREATVAIAGITVIELGAVASDNVGRATNSGVTKALGIVLQGGDTGEFVPLLLLLPAA